MLFRSDLLSTILKLDDKNKIPNKAIHAQHVTNLKQKIDRLDSFYNNLMELMGVSLASNALRDRTPEKMRILSLRFVAIQNASNGAKDKQVYNGLFNLLKNVFSILSDNLGEGSDFKHSFDLFISSCTDFLKNNNDDPSPE